jgi:hypothetical protein
MPEAVVVEFQGKDANLVATANKVDKALDNISTTSKTLDGAGKRTSLSMTDLSSAFSLAERGLQYLKQGYEATVGATLEYANQVRQLSQISGESAEETSRFIQVLDDYKIGADSALTATRALTKNGMSPSIDTLAKLSDQYLKLTSAEEKNAFVIKNLGKSGLEWVEVLNKGSEAIRKQGDAVADGLILNQQQLDEARRLEMAQDALSESWQQFTMTVGNEAIPVLTELVDGLNAGTRAAEIMREQGLNPANKASQEYRDALMQAKEEQQAATEAMLQNNEAIEQNEASLEEQEAAIKATSEANTTFLGVLGQVVSAQDTYNQGLAEARQGLADGTLTTDEYKAKVGELADKYKEASAQIVLSIVEMKLAADGWTNAELSAYLEIGEQQGAFTAQQVEMAEAAVRTADQIIASSDAAGDQIFHTGERALDTAEDFGVMGQSAYELSEAGYDAAGGVGAVKSQIQGLPASGSAWEYFFNIITRGRVPSLPYNTTSTNDALDELREDTGGGRDSGGPGEAGKMYMIGRGAQPEAFIPSSSGSFVPNADKIFDTSGIISAIQSIPQIDEKRLARSIVSAMQQVWA